MPADLTAVDVRSAAGLRQGILPEVAPTGPERRSPGPLQRQWKATFSATITSPRARLRAADHSRPGNLSCPMKPAIHPETPSAATASHVDNKTATAVDITSIADSAISTSGQRVTVTTGQLSDAS